MRFTTHSRLYISLNLVKSYKNYQKNSNICILQDHMLSFINFEHCLLLFVYCKYLSFLFHLFRSHSYMKNYHSLQFMFVISENEWNISAITGLYHSVPIISFIYNITGFFTGIGWDLWVPRFFLRIGKRLISLMLAEGPYKKLVINFYNSLLG